MSKHKSPKKPHQHFIPRTYLKRFAHTKLKKGKFLLAAYDKIEREVKLDISIADICVEDNFYTIKGLPDDQKYFIDDHFTKNIEPKYKDVYDLLVVQKKEIITIQERASILYTILSLYFRTPKVLNEFVSFSTRFMEQSLTNTDVESIKFLGYDIQIKGKTFSEIRKTIKESHKIDYLKTQLALLDQFIEFRKFDGIMVFELIGNQEYITSDNPVEIRTGHGKAFDLFDKTNSIYVPLDTKHAFYIAPKGDESSIDKVFHVKDNQAHHISLNDSVFKNAERWIIGSKFGINQFLIDYDEYNKPADDNHPLILKMNHKLELMKTLLELIDKAIAGDNSDLIKFMKTLKEDSLFEEDIDLQDHYNILKAKGLI